MFSGLDSCSLLLFEGLLMVFDCLCWLMERIEGSHWSGMPYTYAYMYAYCPLDTPTYQLKILVAYCILTLDNYSFPNSKIGTIRDVQFQT